MPRPRTLRKTSEVELGVKPEKSFKKSVIFDEDSEAFNLDNYNILHTNMDIGSNAAPISNKAVNVKISEEDRDFCIVVLPQRLGNSTHYLVFSPALDEDEFQVLWGGLLSPTIHNTTGVPHVAGTALVLNPFPEYALKDTIYIPTDIIILIFSTNDTFSGHPLVLKAAVCMDNTSIFYPTYDNNNNIIGLVRENHPGKVTPKPVEPVIEPVIEPIKRVVNKPPTMEDLVSSVKKRKADVHKPKPRNPNSLLVMEDDTIE